MLQVCFQRCGMSVKILVILVDRGVRVALVRGLKNVLWLEGLCDGNDFELMFLLQLCES